MRITGFSPKKKEKFARSRRVLVLTIVMLVALALPALGQQSGADYQMQQPQQSSQQPQMQFQQPQQQLRPPQQQLQQPQQQLRMMPEEWIRIGYDFDSDGNIDGYDYIFVYDLEQAQMSSRQRLQQQGMMPPQEYDRPMMQQRGMQQQYGMPSMQQRGMQEQQLSGIQGEILGMRTVNLVGIDQPVVLARVQTQDGRTARVNLGPKQQLAQLNLKKGDRIAVLGSRGSIDNNSVLAAQQIATDTQTINIQQPSDLNLRAINARVLDVQTAKFQRANVPDQLFARVRLEDGATTVVDLGPKQQLRNINLQAGDNISMLARPVNIRGQYALVAEQVRAKGKVADINWSQQRQSRTQKTEQ